MPDRTEMIGAMVDVLKRNYGETIGNYSEEEIRRAAEKIIEDIEKKENK